MFTPVLRYDFGALAAAVDVSGRNTHGASQGILHTSSGPRPGRGAADFARPDSRIRVLDRDAFRRLTALKIEATVRLDDTGTRQNLVEGHLSFAFYVNADGSLAGTAREGGSGGHWSGVDTVNDSPDGSARRVPMGRWTTLTYVHDGFTNLSMFIDGELAALTHAAPAPLQSVGWRSVHIGNWPDADSYPLRGGVSDVQIWRWDPQAVSKQFFTRPSSSCWERVARLANDPGEGRERVARLARLYRCVVDAQRAVIAAVRRMPDGPRRISELARSYREQWANGDVGEGEMFTIIETFIGSLDAHERAAFDAALERMRRCFTAMELDLDRISDIDWESCDPQFSRLIRNLMPLVEA